MRQISVVTAALFFSVFCGGVWGQLPENDSKELWARLQEAAADPGKQTVERWTLVEGCPLVKQIEGIPPEYAAAASVLESYNEGGYGLGPLFEGDGRVVIFMNKYLGTDPVRAKVRKKCIEAYRERTIEWKGLFEKAEAQITGPDKLSGAPKGIATSVVLQEMAKALPGDNTLEMVLTKMYEERLYVSVMRREPCNFEVARSLLENGVPFILFVKAGEGAQTRLCVGCVETNGKGYLITADPVSVPLELVSHAMGILPEKESENPRVRESVEKIRQANLAFDEMFGKMPFDMKVSLDTAPEMAGIEFVEWRQDLEMLNIPVPRISPMRIKSFCRDVGKYSDSSLQTEGE